MGDETREPEDGRERPSDDEMTEPGTPDITPAEIETGRDALRELAPVDPVPADVVTRLEQRLAAEPGLSPAPARARRRRRPRLAFAAPGLAVAVAAAVAIVVIAQRDDGGQPQQVAALYQLKQAPEGAPPKAAAGTGASAQDSAAAALVPVPALVGHTLRDARSAAGTGGLHVKRAPSPCTASATSRVYRQRPRAGARVAPGTTIEVQAGRCTRPKDQQSGS
jgi:hypothetical protein